MYVEGRQSVVCGRRGQFHSAKIVDFWYDGKRGYAGRFCILNFSGSYCLCSFLHSSSFFEVSVSILDMAGQRP